MPSILGAARQYSMALSAKNTSRQQAVTPSSAVWTGVRLAVVRMSLEKSTTGAAVAEVGCDCKRTRTTSNGVTKRGCEVSTVNSSELVMNHNKDCSLTQQRSQKTPRHGRHHLLASCDIRYDAASIAIARARNPRDARHAGFVRVYPVVVLAV